MMKLRAQKTGLQYQTKLHADHTETHALYTSDDDVILVI
jgi:hypothetical protein